MLALLSGLSIDCMHSFAAGGPHSRSARAVAAMAQPLLSVVGDAGDSHLSSGAEGMLGLLPFEADDALLPGETMRVELSASRYLALLAALAYDGSTIGQLLLTRPRHAAAVAPLLKVLETRRGDGEGGGGSGAHAICMSVRMACVGRVRLSGVGTDALGIATAVASPAFDYDPDDADVPRTRGCMRICLAREERKSAAVRCSRRRRAFGTSNRETAPGVS